MAGHLAPTKRSIPRLTSCFQNTPQSGGSFDNTSPWQSSHSWCRHAEQQGANDTHKTNQESYNVESYTPVEGNRLFQGETLQKQSVRFVRAPLDVRSGLRGRHLLPTSRQTGSSRMAHQRSSRHKPSPPTIGEIDESSTWVFSTSSQ